MEPGNQRPRVSWWSMLTMRASRVEYLALSLRAHELLQNFQLYDVSVVDLPGGGLGRTVADIRALDSKTAPGRLASALYGLRYWVGWLFGWDQRSLRPEQSVVARLSDSDWRDSEVTPGTADGQFLIIYQFPREALSETLNATVHGFICTALASTATGYRLYWGIYVSPVSWFTRPYLIAIEPFRWILYPSMLRRIRRAWVAAYGV